MRLTRPEFKCDVAVDVGDCGVEMERVGPVDLAVDDERLADCEWTRGMVRPSHGLIIGVGLPSVTLHERGQPR